MYNYDSAGFVLWLEDALTCKETKIRLHLEICRLGDSDPFVVSRLLLWDCARSMSALYSIPTSCKILPWLNWHSVDGPSSTRGDMSAPTFVTRINETTGATMELIQFFPCLHSRLGVTRVRDQVLVYLVLCAVMSHVSLEVVWRSRETNIVLPNLSEVHVSLKNHLYMWTSLWSLRCKQQLLVRQIRDRLKTDILQSVSPVQRSLPS